MSPRTGRPKITNPKSVQVTARLDEETVRKLDESAKTLKLTRAETIRKGIENVYSGVENGQNA